MPAAPLVAQTGGLKSEFILSDYKPWADGKTDDTFAFQRCFNDAAKNGGGKILISPGTYYMAGAGGIEIPSNTTVTATGAKFLLPAMLGDRARITLFQGQDVVNFSWIGGHFQGYCFDPNRLDNTWEPNVHTQIFRITTSQQGNTRHLLFRDITSDQIAGAVINVLGRPEQGSESGIDTFAYDITVENCSLINSGRFCWDYGYLWEILNWPEDYTSWEREYAQKYFPRGLIREGVRFEADGERVFFNNRERPIPVSAQERPQDMVGFFAGRLPASIKRGKAYYIIESGPDYIKVSERFKGPSVRFQNVPIGEAKLMHNMVEAYWQLFMPTNSGDSIGAIDLRCCKGTRITGCTLSARGDTTYIGRCYDNVFDKNHIIGSRMGALYLAEFSKHSTITDNLVEGTNGSRTLSVEKSNEDVKIIGNVFRGGGRGNWINQPRNILIENNSFLRNTTKGEQNPKRGRRTYTTGDYDSFSELYFTIYETEGHYGGVVIRGNTFDTGPEAQHAIGFQRNGSDIQIIENTFLGAKRHVAVDPSCIGVTIARNRGLVPR